MTGKFKSMSVAKKAMFGMGAFVALMVIVGSLAPPPEQEAALATTKQADSLKTSEAKDLAAEATKKPVITTSTVQEVEAIPFTPTTQNDATLASGKTVLAVAGVNGEKTKTFTVTLTDGLETKRELTSEIITKPPINQLTKIGTKAAATPKPASTPTTNCHPSYTGACVPKGVSDVDCAGGSGNGPYYVGRVTVVGPDIYDLDRDGNGIGCE